MAEHRALDPVVTFMASRGLSARLLAEHVDDGTGHCAGCTWQQRARPVHPCPIRCYAERAAETTVSTAGSLGVPPGCCGPDVRSTTQA